MPPRRVKPWRRAARWLVPAAGFALAPKCLLCLAGYFGVAAALGRGSVELCGGPETAVGSKAWTGWALAVEAGVASVAGLIWLARKRGSRADRAHVFVPGR